MDPSHLPAERSLASDAVFPASVRAWLLDILKVRDDAERAGRIGGLHADERSRGFAELLIDAEEDTALRAVLVGMLREVIR